MLHFALELGITDLVNEGQLVRDVDVEAIDFASDVPKKVERVISPLTKYRDVGVRDTITLLLEAVQDVGSCLLLVVRKPRLYLTRFHGGDYVAGGSSDSV